MPPGEDQTALWIALTVGSILALIVLPLMAFPLAALAFLGVACARSAIVNRQVGWVGGFIFGTVLAIAAIGGIVAITASRLGWKF